MATGASLDVGFQQPEVRQADGIFSTDRIHSKVATSGK